MIMLMHDLIDYMVRAPSVIYGGHRSISSSVSLTPFFDDFASRREEVVAAEPEERMGGSERCGKDGLSLSSLSNTPEVHSMQIESA